MNPKLVVHGVRRASLAACPYVHCFHVTPCYIASYKLAKPRRGAPKARPRTLFRPHEPQIRVAWCALGGRASRCAPSCIAAVSHPITLQVIDWRSHVGARQRHARGPCFVRTNRKFVAHGVRRACLTARPYVFRPRGSCKWVCDPYFPGTNTFLPLMMYRPRGSWSTGVVTFVPERV